MGKQQTASLATNVIPTRGTQPQVITRTSEPSVGSITHEALLSKALGFLGMLDNGQLWGG